MGEAYEQKDSQESVLHQKLKGCCRCGEQKSVSEFHKWSHGSDGLRHECKSCRKKDTREYYLRNKERILQQSREWQKNNPERRRETSRIGAKRRYHLDPEKGREATRRWRELNPEKELAARRERIASGKESARLRAWRKNNPHKSKEQDHRRRARIMQSQGVATGEQIAARVAFYAGRCWMCGRPYANTIDHVIPLARGGSHWPSNLRPACKSCNSRKGAKRIYAH